MFFDDVVNLSQLGLFDLNLELDGSTCRSSIVAGAPENRPLNVDLEKR